MTRENKNKIQGWFRDNLMLLIITALLSVIGFGGKSIMGELQEEQKAFDVELKTYREVQMGILKTIETDKTASGFWFDAVKENKQKNCEQDKAITNHEIRIRSLEDD